MLKPSPLSPSDGISINKSTTVDQEIFVVKTKINSNNTKININFDNERKVVRKNVDGLLPRKILRIRQVLSS